MNVKTKAGWAAGLLLALFIAGSFASGHLVLLFLGLRDAPLAWDTWWGYFRALDLPQYAPFANKIKGAGALGFGLPLLLWLFALFALFKPRQTSFHGDARFATRADLKKAGLLDDTPEGIVIGRFGRDLLRLDGTQHVIMTAPTRTGKTTGVAIPVLLTYGHSIVAMDLKGELYQLTSGWRAKQGQTIRVFAPYDETGRTHRFNPFQMMSGDPRMRIGEIQTIAAILYPDDPNKDPFWVNQSRTTFFAFASYLFEQWDHRVRQLLKLSTARDFLPDPNSDPQFPSFEHIYKLSAGSDGKDTKALIQDILQGEGKAVISDATRTAFSGLASLAEQTFSSVIGSMQEPLQQFLSPILAAATNASDFNVATLRKEPTTIYVVIPPEKLGESSKLLNIFFSTVVGQNLRATPQEDKTIKHQLLLLLDEFTAMGRVDVLSKRISLTAGYWVRDLSIIQSLSQLDSTYGADEARTYITNHAASIVFTPREQRDAEEYSKQLGDTTVKRRNRSVGHGGTSYSYTEERRALMLPQELKALGNEEELIFFEGCPPIRCSKIRYFKDSYFTKRVLPKVELEAIANDAKPMAGQGGALHFGDRDLSKLRALSAQGLTSDQTNNPTESDDMNFRQMTATAALGVGAATALSGCGDSQDYSKIKFQPNPNPQERYELIVEVKDAPKQLKYAGGNTTLVVANAGDCMPPREGLAGVRPDGLTYEVNIDFELTQTSDTTWKGEFYRDSMLEAPYYGYDVCRFWLNTVDVTLKPTGAEKEIGLNAHLYVRPPGLGDPPPDLAYLHVRSLSEGKPVVVYFSKSRALSKIQKNPIFHTDYGSSRSQFNPDVTDADLFTITLTAKKVTP